MRVMNVMTPSAKLSCHRASWRSPCCFLASPKMKFHIHQLPVLKGRPPLLGPQALPGSIAVSLCHAHCNHATCRAFPAPTRTSCAPQQVHHPSVDCLQRMSTAPQIPAARRVAQVRERVQRLVRPIYAKRWKMARSEPVGCAKRIL